MSLAIVTDPVLGESVRCGTTAAGLRVRVVEKPGFRETAAAITFAYGSTDLEFTDAAGPCRTPPGTAHFLEHKLFEDEELHTFEAFARRGARVNAQTGFTRTTYHFTATSAVRENLQDLLRLCAHAHVTPANVDKERPIIAQEVRMYEDSPDYCTTFDLLGCMYGNHPVRYTVGGTVASIAAIDQALLLRCWRAFYGAGNAALAVVGPVDANEVFALAEACELPAGAGPVRHVAADFGPVPVPRRERAMQVARPKVLIGCKEREFADGWRARTQRQLATRALQDRLFAGSSEVREQLHDAGDVDDTLGAGYYGEQTFAFATVGCESDEPERAEAALRRVLLRPAPLTEEHLERVRRRHLGAYVRSFENTRGMAFAHAHEALDGAPPFHGYEAMQALRLEDVRARQEVLLRPENLAVAVTRRA
jgi:predicted Zn-dependent peptidase